MGANDGFIPEENKKCQYMKGMGYKEETSDDEALRMAKQGLSWAEHKIEKEQPLTHHQQAVKEFMVVLIGLDATRTWTPEELSNKAHKLADAFINQISKK